VVVLVPALRPARAETLPSARRPSLLVAARLFYDRVMRRARKLCRRLGGEPDDDTYPEKPKRMRWTTYNRLMDELVAADDVADGRLVLPRGTVAGGDRPRDVMDNVVNYMD
jgi:hypothetical protein